MKNNPSGGNHYFLNVCRVLRDYKRSYERPFNCILMIFVTSNYANFYTSNVIFLYHSVK